jgi:hypothetical protein
MIYVNQKRVVDAVIARMDCVPNVHAFHGNPCQCKRSDQRG